MARTEVERADSQKRLMLEVACEAFEDAGLTEWRGKTIGTYIGNFGEDWLEILGRETQPWRIRRVSSSGDFVVANCLSYAYLEIRFYSTQTLGYIVVRDNSTV